MIIKSVFDLVRKELIEEREYQLAIAKSAVEKGNTLVVLPTGLGKTLIAIYVIADAVEKGKRALMLAPTKPLAEQHFTEIKKYIAIPESDISLVTGKIEKTKRLQEETKRIIVATPQTIVNDIKEGRFSLSDFGVVVFDEAHKTVGNYAYTYIAEECVAKKIKILALTASPGGNKSRINNLISSLAIENIEIRTKDDPDVIKYVNPIQIQVIKVQLNAEIRSLAESIEKIAEEKRELLNSTGVFRIRSTKVLTKKELLAIGNKVFSISGNLKYKVIPAYIAFLNLAHSYDLIQTEGVEIFLKYIKKKKEENHSRAFKSLLNDGRFQNLIKRAENLVNSGVEHPKLSLLIDLISSRKDKTVLVFTQFREQVDIIVSKLKEKGIEARPFVGKKNKNTQEQQEKTIAEFREGKFKVLVATSIGEEGLDIPRVDSVIFYEPVPSEIRTIQRKGRAGRTKAGEVIILVTSGTKDEVYFFVSAKKEKRMYNIIESITSPPLEKKKKKRKTQKKLF